MKFIMPSPAAMPEGVTSVLPVMVSSTKVIGIPDKGAVVVALTATGLSQGEMVKVFVIVTVIGSTALKVTLLTQVTIVQSVFLMQVPTAVTLRLAIIVSNALQVDAGCC